jgi:hypothetical protein
MNNLKVWPHLTIVAIVVAVLAGVGVAWWMKKEPTASAASVPNAARIQRVEGDVALNNGKQSGRPVVHGDGKPTFFSRRQDLHARQLARESRL